MSRAELLDAGVITAVDFDAAADLAMALFRFGQKHCADRGRNPRDIQRSAVALVDFGDAGQPKLPLPATIGAWVMGCSKVRVMRLLSALVWLGRVVFVSGLWLKRVLRRELPEASAGPQ